MLMFLAPTLMKNSKMFQKIWPYSFTDEEQEGDGNQKELVASGARWKSLVSVGMLMGVIGGVCGNYVGITVAYLIRMITGA